MFYIFQDARRGRFFSALFFLIVLIPSLYANDKITPAGYRWPIDATRMFTSSFAELRPGRFHAGLDFSTGGNIGHPCFAIADGYISRVKVRHNGYGKAVYLSYGDNEIAVYAHLDRFTDDMEDKIYEVQRAQQDFEVELFFQAHEFPVKRGDVIAYSGATGVGPPHLHFEMRRGMTVPYNPTLAGFVVNDNRLPTIRSIALIPLNEDAVIDGDIFPKVYNSNTINSKAPRFFGRIGISANVADFQDKGWYRLGAAEIEVFIDDKLVHVTKPESFKYVDQRQSRLHFNFFLERHSYKRMQNLFVFEQNKLNFYDRSLPGSILDTKELAPGDHTVKIRASDFAGNQEEVEFIVVAQGSPFLPLPKGKGPTRTDSKSSVNAVNASISTSLFRRILRIEVEDFPTDINSVEFAISPYNVSHSLVPTNRNTWIGRALLPSKIKDNTELEVYYFVDDSLVGIDKQSINLATFTPGKSNSWQIDDNFVLEISSDDLWFDLSAKVTILPQEDVTLAPVYSLRPYEHPFANPFKIRFKNNDAPWDSNAVVCYKDAQKPDLGWIFLGRVMNGDKTVLSATALSFEDFSVMIDSIPPVIDNISPSDGKVLRDTRPKLVATLDDTLSGVNLADCDFELDGIPVIWEFDPDVAKIFYRSRESLSKGTHQWRLIITDNVGNRTVKDSYFTVR